MKKQIRAIKLRAYQTLYAWALKCWRKEMDNEQIHKREAKISNHALMRYAERFDDYDFEKVKKKLLTVEVENKISDLGGDGKFSVNGVMYVVKKGTIVTVIKPYGVEAYLTYQPLDGERGRRWSF